MVDFGFSIDWYTWCRLHTKVEWINFLSERYVYAFDLIHNHILTVTVKLVYS